MSKNLVGSSDINIVTNGDNISLELAKSYYNKEEVDNELNKKVNTQDGKDLSSNDFTDTLKTKLNGIEAGAEVNKIAVVKVDGTALTPSSKAVNIDLSGKQNKLTAGSNIQINGSTISATDTTYSKATSSADGLMSSTDKAKIDTVEENAQENKIESLRKSVETNKRLESEHNTVLGILEDDNIKPSYKTSAIIYSVLIKKSIELDELEKYLREYKNEEKNTEYNKLLVVYDYMRYGD